MACVRGCVSHVCFRVTLLCYCFEPEIFVSAFLLRPGNNAALCTREQTSAFAVCIIRPMTTKLAEYENPLRIA